MIMNSAIVHFNRASSTQNIQIFTINIGNHINIKIKRQNQYQRFYSATSPLTKPGKIDQFISKIYLIYAFSRKQLIQYDFGLMNRKNSQNNKSSINLKHNLLTMLQFPGNQGEGIDSDGSLYIRLAALATVPIVLTVTSIVGVRSGKVSSKFKLFVTPPAPFFFVWGIIYLSLLVSAIYSAVSNTWSLGVLVMFGIVNLLNAAWVYVFSFGTNRSNIICTIILIMMAILNEVQWVWMELTFKTSSDVSNWNIVNRNIFALYEGWLVTAANLNLGIVLVYCFGMKKETQAYIFWIMCPLFILGLIIFDLTYPKGFVNSNAMYLSAVYALLGSYISTKSNFDKQQDNLISIVRVI